MVDQQDARPDRDEAIRCVIAVRRMLKDAITAELVLNPAVDMLLALYLDRRSDEPMSLADLCEYTSTVEEVCRHWGLALAQRGFVAIDGDGCYRLSDEGHRVMRKVNDDVWALATEHLRLGLMSA